MEVQELSGPVPFWRKAFWLFVSPVRCFEALREDRDWFAAWLTAAFVALISFVVLLPFMNRWIEESAKDPIGQARAKPRLDELRGEGEPLSDKEHQQTRQEITTRMLGAAGRWTICCVLSPVAITLVQLLVASAATHLVASLAGLRGTFRGMLPIWAYANLLAVPDTILTAVGKLVTGNPAFELNAAFLLHLAPMSSPVGAALAALAPFTIWNVVLASVGLSVVRQGSRTKSFAIILGLWFLTIVFSAALTLLAPYSQRFTQP